MKTKRVAVLGAGNIGLAVAEGIMSSGKAKGKIILTRRSGKFSKKEKEKFQCLTHNIEAVSQAGIVIIAVRPKQMDELLKEIKEALTAKHLLVSVASGVSIQRIEELAGEVAVVRVMLNTAVRVAESVICLAFNQKGQEHKDLAENIFEALGLTLFIPEAMFAEVTVLCGSGVALAMKFLRAYMQACIQNGFNEYDALKIASQVLKGAATIVEKGGSHPEVEIDKVTTPNGCTIAALVEMEHSGFSSALLKAIEAGIREARKLYS